ncbi:MAG: hypothetical protein ACJAT2_000237 [Bacteriovoracaceae bacterium]|jgi:hypothetical protein
MEIKDKKSELLSFLNSGILFHKDGGIHAWISNVNEPAFLYSEISGYFLTLSSYLISTGHVKESDPIFKQAEKTCKWLLEDMLTKHGSFVDRKSNDKFGSKTFFFDDFIIIQGIINYSSILGKKDILGRALILLKDLSSYWRDDQGYCSLKDLDGGLLDSQETWSTTIGPHHLKAVLPLLNAFESTKDSFYKDEAFSLKEYIFKNFLEDDLFLSEPDSIHSHSLLYALEAMIIFNHYFPDDVLKKVILKNFSTLTMQIDKGSIPRFKKEGVANYNPRVDIYFQYLRVQSLIEYLNITDLECNQKMIIERIEKYYNKDSYVFGTDGLGKEINDKTSWINFMALQYYISLETDKSLLLKYLV